MVRYRERVRRILSVSSRELMYEDRARSTSDMGHAVGTGIFGAGCVLLPALPTMRP